MRETKSRALLVGVHLRNDPGFEGSMEELRGLVEAFGAGAVAALTQKADQPHPAHYIGTGKLRELAEQAAAAEAELVVCNDELSPSQIRNLEAALPCRVVDRTMLILDIFGQRARTREAKLQVEVARMQYMLPRLTGRGEAMDRQGGRAGLKNRGSGETKLELDRRRLEARIATLNRELETLVSQRQVRRTRRARNETPVVCLVGYTNAGKSSLMNALVEQFGSGSAEKRVLAQDRLFATLETSVRRLWLPPDRRPVLLADTVGFVDRLPHHLVKAFRSTLEELTGADLLLHVVDVAHPDRERQEDVTTRTLRSLGADGIPRLTVYNKADLTAEPWPAEQGDAIRLSAARKKGIELLAQRMHSLLYRDQTAESGS